MGLVDLGRRFGKGIAEVFIGKALSGDFANPQPCPVGGPNTEILTGGAGDFYGDMWARTEADIWEDFDDADLLAIYKLNAIVYACCNMIASSYAQPPLELGRTKSDGTWLARPNEPLQNLVNRPNDWYTLNVLEQVNMKRKLLTGAAFTWKWRNNGGEVVELWPMVTSMVTVAVGKCGIAGYYLNKDKPSELFIPPEDMIYDRFQAVDSIFGYTAPLTAALHAYQIDKSREEYLMKMIGKLNQPGLVIEQNAPDGIQRQGLTDKQRADLRASLAEQGTGGIPIIPPGLTMRFPGVVQDLDWGGVEGDVAARICMVFGVPPIIIGARIGLERSTYANYGEARRSFYNETLEPLWVAGGETWTRFLIEPELEHLPPRASGWEFKYNLTDIPELQEDVNERMDRGVKALSSGGITVNEFRTVFADMDKVDDGEVYLRQSSVVVEPVGESAEARAAAAAVNDDETSEDVIEPEQE